MSESQYPWAGVEPFRRFYSPEHDTEFRVYFPDQDVWRDNGGCFSRASGITESWLESNCFEIIPNPEDTE